MDVEKMIAAGESATVEFKENFDRETIETVVAFSNTRGGAVIIGVGDKRDVKGVSTGRDTIRNWSNQVSQSTEPRVIPDIHVEECTGRRSSSFAFKNSR